MSLTWSSSLSASDEDDEDEDDEDDEDDDEDADRRRFLLPCDFLRLLRLFFFLDFFLDEPPDDLR